MVTDPPPGDHTLRVEFLKSDRIDSLDLPQDDGLRSGVDPCSETTC